MWEGWRPKVIIQKNTIYSHFYKFWDALNSLQNKVLSPQLTFNVEQMIPAERLERPVNQPVTFLINHRNSRDQ